MGRINSQFALDSTVNIRESIARVRTLWREWRDQCAEGRRSQGDPEEGDFVARVPKGSITKMIGCAIGGDGNCVNGVIITNLEAISSRPDQSEDAPPFPVPGPFLPFLVSDPTLATVIEFLSSSFSNPESHSPRRRRHRRRRRRRRRCISVVVSLCDTRKFTLVPFRLHSEHPDPSALSPVLCGPPVTLLSLIARNDYLVRWGGTTSGNLRRHSFLAFARNNDLFYNDDSSPSSTLSFSPSAHPHRPRE